MALPVGNFPRGGSDRIRSDWRNRGLGSLPGGPSKPLQVSGIEGPGFHKPARDERHGGGAVSTETQNPRANPWQERRLGGGRSSDRRLTEKYLNLVQSQPQ